MYAVDDERRVRNRAEIRETLSGKAFPIAERCDLCSSDLWSRHSVEILVPLPQSLDERGAGGLAARSEREENLLQDAVPFVRWILQMLREPWLLEMHDVLAAARGGPDQD